MAETTHHLTRKTKVRTRSVRSTFVGFVYSDIFWVFSSY